MIFYNLVVNRQKVIGYPVIAAQAGMTGLLNDFPWTVPSLKELTF